MKGEAHDMSTGRDGHGAEQHVGFEDFRGLAVDTGPPPEMPHVIENHEATARRVRCPVLLLASDPAVGGMLPSQDAADLAAALPDCCRVDFPGRGHLLHGEQPEEVLKVVFPFLESLR